MFNNFFAIDKKLSLGPKRSIARIFSKISCSHGDRRLWITFLSNIICVKPPRTVFKCPKGSLTLTLEVILSFLQDLRSCWKNNFSKKKAILPVRKKNYGPPFSRFIKCDKPQRTVCKGLQGFSIVTVLVIISILQDLRGCWKFENTIFLEKRQTFQWRKDFGLLLLILLNITKVRKLFLRDHKVCLTFFLQLIKVSLWDLKGR